MTREQAREYINSLIGTELTRARKRISGHDSYICPFCGNGSGADGTGISTKDGKRYTCFRGCFSGLDYLDILKRQHVTDKERDIFDRYNLSIDSGPDPPTEKNYATDYNFSQYYKLCNSRAGQTDYFSFRGISAETVNRFMLGYDPEWRHPKAPYVPATARVIIPTGKNSYVARDTNPFGDKKYSKMKVGESRLFNAKALQETGHPYIFIVEGEFDALSVIDVGGQAVAIGSTSNKNKLIQAVKNMPPTVPLVLSLDVDENEAGQKAQAEIKKELEALNVSFLEVNLGGEYKDANEHLQNDAAVFAGLVKNPLKAEQLEQERRINAYMERNVAASSLNAFMGEIAESANTPAIPTGFSMLDGALDGGFYEGLFILGAISSIGKTSFSLQIADQMARQGQDVIIFSLEMSKYELISKSLSRLTFMADKEKNEKGFHHARTNRQITAGAKYARYSKREKDLIAGALKTYSGEYAQNLYIHEGEGIKRMGTGNMHEAIREHISVTGKRPVVIIDYLQIIAPADIRATDKTNTDTAVTELKIMSREYKIPIFAISSFNRDNYLSPVNMASFKESGAIEYSSDILFGLQFEGMDEIKQTDSKKTENLNQIEEWKQAEPRRVQLKILKNRNGATGISIFYNYYPKFNYFRERENGK